MIFFPLVWTSRVTGKVLQLIPAAYGKKPPPPPSPNEVPAHCRALCDPSGVLYLAHGYLGSALKVSLPLLKFECILFFFNRSLVVNVFGGFF